MISNGTYTNKFDRRALASALSDPNTPYRHYGQNKVQLVTRDNLLLEIGGGSPEGIEIYYSLMSDSHVISCLDRIYQIIMEFPMEIVIDPKYSKNPTHVAIKDFLNNLFFKKERSEILLLTRNLALCQFMGVSVSEIVWKLKDGMVIFDKIIPVDSRRISYVVENTDTRDTEIPQLYILTTLNQYYGVRAPDKKFIEARYYSVPIETPYGFGVAHQIYWLVRWKRTIQEYWVQIADKFSMPGLVVNIPENPNEEDVDMAVEALRNFSKNFSAVLPPNFSVDTLDFGSTGAVDNLLISFIDYVDSKISQAILGEAVTGEQLANGSYSRDKVASGISTQKGKTVANIVESAINETLVKWLIEFNFGQVEDPPSLKIQTEDSEDLDSLMNHVVQLDQIGYKIDKDWIEEKFNIPQMPEEQRRRRRRR